MQPFKKQILGLTIYHLVASSLLLKGCATPSQTIGLSGVAGAGIGAIAGGLSDPGKDGKYRTRNVVIGSALGGATGLVTGAFMSNAVENGKAEGKKQAKSEQLVGAPLLKDPRVEARWVESKVVGNRYVEGHFEYQIVEPAQWEAKQ